MHPASHTRAHMDAQHGVLAVRVCALRTCDSRLALIPIHTGLHGQPALTSYMCVCVCLCVWSSLCMRMRHMPASGRPSPFMSCPCTTAAAASRSSHVFGTVRLLARSTSSLHVNRQEEFLLLQSLPTSAPQLRDWCDHSSYALVHVRSCLSVCLSLCVCVCMCACVCVYKPVVQLVYHAT